MPRARVSVVQRPGGAGGPAALSSRRTHPGSSSPSRARCGGQQTPRTSRARRAVGYLRRGRGSWLPASFLSLVAIHGYPGSRSPASARLLSRRRSCFLIWRSCHARPKIRIPKYGHGGSWRSEWPLNQLWFRRSLLLTLDCGGSQSWTPTLRGDAYDRTKSARPGPAALRL